MTPGTPRQSRRDRELAQAEKHREAAAEWGAVAITAGCILKTPELTRMTYMPPMFRAVGSDAVGHAFRHATYATALTVGPSPYRSKQRERRRVRMARKRRRGWA